MSPIRKLLISALALASMPCFAAVRLTYQLYGTAVPVAWSSGAFPIRYSVDRRVADAFPQGVIDRAFNQWTTVTDSRVTFQSAGVASAQPGRDGQNTVTFVDD